MKYKQIGMGGFVIEIEVDPPKIIKNNRDKTLENFHNQNKIEVNNMPGLYHYW